MYIRCALIHIALQPNIRANYKKQWHKPRRIVAKQKPPLVSLYRRCCVVGNSQHMEINTKQKGRGTFEVQTKPKGQLSLEETDSYMYQAVLINSKCEE